MKAGRKSVVSNLSSSLVERNHELDHLFSVKEIIMKEKPKKKKDDTEHDEEDDEILDAAGYRDLPTVGVSITNSAQANGCLVLATLSTSFTDLVTCPSINMSDKMTTFIGLL